MKFIKISDLDDILAHYGLKAVLEHLQALYDAAGYKATEKEPMALSAALLTLSDPKNP